MSDDTYWYPAKPEAALVRRQALSLEERGAAITYQDQMFARDGTIPSEQTPEGLAWHRTVLGLRDRRKVERLVQTLLDGNHLVRLGDGRLTSKEVQRELARRAGRKKAGEGSGGQGSGGQGSGSGSNDTGQPRQLVLIEGGLSPQPPVDNPVDEPGTENETAARRVSKTRLRSVSRRKTQENQGWPRLIIQQNRNHEVVAAESRFRARGDPWAARPP